MTQTSAGSANTLPTPVERSTTPTSSVPGHLWRWKKGKTVIGISVSLLVIILGTLLFGPQHWASGFQGGLGAHSLSKGPVVATLGVTQAPYDDLTFSSTITGTIDNIFVDIGQRVVAGQALAHLGNNDYPERLHQAQVTVDASRKIVNAANAHVANQIAYIHATVFLAQDTLTSALNNWRALQRQAQANIHFAMVKLDADRQTLNAVIKAAIAAIAAARQTLKSSIAACTASTGSSGGSTTASKTASTGSSSGSTTDSKTASTGSSGGSTTDSSSSTQSLCISTAQATYKSSVASTNVTVTAAKATVRQDQAALQQAYANANVSLVAQNGLIREARDSIQVARLNPDLTAAFLDLANAEYTYRTALAVLLVAQRDVDLTTLRAPHAGNVTAIIGTIGGQPGAVDNLVPAGGLEIQSDHGGLTFIQVVDTDNVNRVFAFVDETDIAKVQVGETATFTPTSEPDHALTGTVTNIAANGYGYPSTTQTNTKFIVYIGISAAEAASLHLFSHMTGKVTIG